MPNENVNQDGLDACKAAFQSSIAGLNHVLISNLATAQTDEEKQKFIAEFKKGVDLSKEARQICESAFK